jgi:hypothetical protein
MFRHRRLFRPHQPRHYPRLESLEDRSLPSMFTVLNLDDDGPGSLRRAVLDANDNPGSDQITFASELSGTIALTSGQLSLMDDVVIDGPGRRSQGPRRGYSHQPRASRRRR